MRQVEQLSAEMVALRREICSVGSRQPGCKALQRHYGIGPLLAVAIWEELGDCRRFTSSDDAVRHAGLDVTVWSSDGKRTRGHLAKQGPPVLRWEPGVVLTAGAATFVAYVLTHPRGDRTGAETLEEMVHSMSVESAWEVSHLIGLVAFVVIGAGMWMLLRAGWLADDKRARRAAGVVVVGTVAAAIESIPHILVGSETGKILTGGSTPFTDLHLALQATLLPVYAAGVAALAVAGFGRVAHPIACVLGVIGGAALALVGPLLLLTDEPGLGRLFMAGSGTFLFLLAAGSRVLRQSADRTEPATIARAA